MEEWKEEEYRYIRMVQGMKAGGRITCQMVTEGCYMLPEVGILDFGRKVKQKDMEYIKR